MGRKAKTKKRIIAGIYYNSNGYNVSINRIVVTKGILKEIKQKFVGSIQEVAALLQQCGVSAAAIDAYYPSRLEIQALQKLNDYTKQVIYSIMFMKGHQMFVIDQELKIVYVGILGNSYVDIGSYTDIAKRIYTEYM